jgi:hypothetical protein
METGFIQDRDSSTFAWLPHDRSLLEPFRHVIQWFAGEAKGALDPLIEILKEETLQRLTEVEAGMAGVARLTILVSGKGRISDHADVVARPSPARMANQFRLIRYAIDPTFAKGKFLDVASQRFVELLRAPPYLAAPPTGQMREILRATWSESPPKLRALIGRLTKST